MSFSKHVSADCHPVLWYVGMPYHRASATLRYCNTRARLRVLMKSIGCPTDSALVLNAAVRLWIAEPLRPVSHATHVSRGLQCSAT